MDMERLSIRTNDLVTCNGAAKILGVSRPTIYHMIERHQLHSIMIGRNRYLLRAELESLKARRKSNGNYSL